MTTFKAVPKGVTLLFTRRADGIELDLLTVAHECRGRGLGSRAVRALQRLGQRIELKAVPDQRKGAALHRFYRRLGFRPVRRDCCGFTEFQWTPGGGK